MQDKKRVEVVGVTREDLDVMQGMAAIAVTECAGLLGCKLAEDAKQHAAWLALAVARLDDIVGTYGALASMSGMSLEVRYVNKDGKGVRYVNKDGKGVRS